MKCICCGSSFEPSPKEKALLMKDRMCSYIPFCSKECYKIAYGTKRAVPDHSHLYYHEGEVVRPKIGGNHQITVRPMTETEAESVRHWRGREGFSYGCTVCILPSAIFYGRHRSPLNWE